jgi:secretion/DNA translocation related TadE-like protein
MSAGRPSAGERGSATVLMASIMGVVVTVSSAAMVVAGYLVAHHQARAAADLAALSGAAAYTRGANACDEARRISRQNGARVTSCKRVGDEIDFVVSVRTTVSVRTLLPGLPRVAEAEAHAGRVVS